jgi:hypothetical protein
MAQGGLYARLAQLQFGSGDTEAAPAVNAGLKMHQAAGVKMHQ